MALGSNRASFHISRAVNAFRQERQHSINGSENLTIGHGTRGKQTEGIFRPISGAALDGNTTGDESTKFRPS
jgi:hypothetical protein